MPSDMLDEVPGASVASVVESVPDELSSLSLPQAEAPSPSTATSATVPTSVLFIARDLRVEGRPWGGEPSGGTRPSS
jgi:hypothetical protein